MAQLHQYNADLDARNTQVVLISFGNTELAQAWIAETQTAFKFLLDPERKTYRAFSLDYSMRRSWSPKVWLEYARLLAKGRKWRGIQGDSGQLGGDFIIDPEGILRMAYRSHDPTDRPAIDYLLKRLDQINGHHAGDV